MIKYIGIINRKKVNELYGKSRAGIVLYQPAANHLDSQPIKLFEYMAAGLPVIASDFPLWKRIVENNKCGICVDPTNVCEIITACKFFLKETKIGKQMGMAGRNAIVKQYNWENESLHLLNLYQELYKKKR